MEHFVPEERFVITGKEWVIGNRELGKVDHLFTIGAPVMRKVVNLKNDNLTN